MADQKKTQSKSIKENPTEFNNDNNITIAGIKEKKLTNITKIEDVKLYKEKYID